MPTKAPPLSTNLDALAFSCEDDNRNCSKPFRAGGSGRPACPFQNVRRPRGGGAGWGVRFGVFHIFKYRLFILFRL